MPSVLTPRVPVNQILHDQWIRHAVMLERLKTSEIRAMIKLLDKQVAPAIIAKADKIATRWGTMGYSKLSIARRRRALLKQLRDMDRLIKGGNKVMYARLHGQMAALAKSEAAWAANMLQRQIPLTLNYSLPAPHLLQSIVTTHPMQGKFLREWTKAAGANTAKQVRQAIMIGVAQGEGVGPIVRRIRGTAANGFKDGVMQAARHEAAMVTRTAISHVSSHAREALFAEHKDVIEKVRWMSTLDTRTSQICASLDGQTYSVGRGPRPPAHPNCRSTMVPIAKPPVGIPGIDASKLPPAQRAAMGGPVPASTGFGPWLKGQSVASQNAMLGVGKAKLFRRGKVPIEKFTDLKTLRPLTLTQLQRLEAKLTGTKFAPKVKPKAKPKAKPKPKQAKAKSTKPTTKAPPQKTKPTRPGQFQTKEDAVRWIEGKNIEVHPTVLKGHKTKSLKVLDEARRGATLHELNEQAFLINRIPNHFHTLINASAPGPRAAMVRGRGVTIHPSMAHKARVRPRGYPKGSTFADCKGCSTQVDGGPFTITEMVSARPKYSSSVNTWAHEATHGYDKAWGKAYGEWSGVERYAATDTKWYGISGSPAWQRIHTATNWNNAYLASHSSESFAEGMAMYLEGGIQRAKLAPKAREFLARVANDTLEGKHLL